MESDKTNNLSETKYQNRALSKLSCRKYIIPAVIIPLLMIASLVFIWFTQEEQKPDPASEKIIREAAALSFRNKRPNDLTDKDLAKVKIIIIFNENLSDIKFLEKFPNLEYLFLDDIDFPEDVFPKWMKFLAKYGVFNLKERCYIDLSPLRKLRNLQSLAINSTPVKNYKPLSSLNNLHSLNLARMDVHDLKSIKNLSKLETLYLRGADVSDLQLLKGLKNLQMLFLDGTDFCDLKLIKNLTNLRMLELSKTDVNNLEPIGGLVNLQKLYLNETHVSDLNPVRQLTNLLRLELNFTMVSNLEPLSSLNNLIILNIQGTRVSNLEPIGGMQNLKWLGLKQCGHISNKQIEDLKKALPELEISK